MKKSFVSFYTYAAIDRTDLVIPEVVHLTFENRLPAVGDRHVLHDGREIWVKSLWEREMRNLIYDFIKSSQRYFLEWTVSWTRENVRSIFSETILLHS